MIRRQRKIPCVVAFLIVTLAGTAFGFDTGPHFDMTRDVLTSEGFSSNAVETVQSGNYLVDFYEFMGSKGLQIALDPVCQSKEKTTLAIGDAQHFDDLENTAEVAHKWDAMLAGTKGAADSLSKAGQIMPLMVLLGMSLHNVQDFYTHSNWVDPSPLGPGIGKGALAKYGDHPTWLSMDRAERERLDVYTRHTDPSKPPKRTHGTWESNNNATADSLNKDWAGRVQYTDAYICAYFASRQWVRLFKGWVDPAVWSKMQKLARKDYDPSRDHLAAERVSFYGGHWNGNGSGYSLSEMHSSHAAGTSLTFLVNEATNYLEGTCLTKKRTKLRQQVENLLNTWGKMPYAGPVNPALPSAAPENLRFVQLKIHRIDNVNADDGKTGGQMDWYSFSSIEGQKYMSGLIDEHDNFNFDTPPYYPWTMTKALPVALNSVQIGFTMMELDAVDDDMVDINPKSGESTLVFRYDPSTGKLRGDLSGTGTVVSKGAGDCDCAQVSIGVESTVASCLK